MTAVDTIPFFLDEVEDINVSSLKTMENAKKNIMGRFITRAKEVHSGAGTGDLLNIYRQWNSSTEGSIASIISQELSNLMGNYTDLKMTSASFAEDVYTRIENRVGIGPQSDIEKYASMAEEIEYRLNNMIDILMKEKPTIELAILCNCIGRKIPDPELAQKYEGRGVFLGDIDGKKAKTIQVLQNYYNSLKEAGKGNVAALASPKGEIPSPSDVANAVAGALSSVAGESFYEILVTIVANRVIKEFNKIDEQIIQDFLKKGFSLISQDIRAKQSADVNLSGQQGKPDLYIYWNENGLVISIGGSVKFRQANTSFSNGKFIGKIKYRVSLKEIFDYADQLAPGASKSLTGALGAVLRTSGAEWGGGYVQPSDLNSFAEAWEELKQRAVLLGFIDKFAGTGETNNFGETNFADVLIINQEVIPIYNILQDIMLNGFSNAVTLSGNGWTWKFSHSHFPYWTHKNRKKYHTKGEKENESLRTSLFDSMMESIYNKKIYISFSLSKLT